MFSLLGLLVGLMTSSKGRLWSWGVSSTATLSFSKASVIATEANALLANTPQVALSLCYMSSSSFCTAIASAQEWNNLGIARKGLRVSEPRGEQRSTYFLQLPYKWAVPLGVVSTALHWLLSQTFFLVRFDVYDGDRYLNGFSAGGASGVSFVVFLVVFFGL